MPSYWVTDPQQPTLAIFEWAADGRYVQVAEAKGDDPFDTTRPFTVRLVPVELLGTLAHTAPTVPTPHSPQWRATRPHLAWTSW